MTKNNLYSHLKKLVLHFCTISTASHLFKSYALADSLAVHGLGLTILVVDDFEETSKPSNVTLTALSDRFTEKNYTAVYQKYKNQKDKLRWALKPVLLLDALQHYDQVIYVDNDCFFFGSPHFMEELLQQHAVLLTPHFYKSIPTREQNWLEANYRVGLYNAGFVAVNKKANAALEWWLQCCLYSLKKAFWRGLFDDQRYLDLLPIQFDEVYVLKHRGCNLAGWNDDSVEVEDKSNGWWLNKKEELVFVHFASLTLEKWASATHKAHPIYKRYYQAISKYNPNYSHKNIQLDYKLSAYFYYLRWKLVRIFE